MTKKNKIVKVYILKGINGTSLVIENYRVSDEKIYGMLTPIYTFEVAPYCHCVTKMVGAENG